jgi:hypothetical protein
MVKSVKIAKTLKGRLNFNWLIKGSILIVSINISVMLYTNGIDPSVKNFINWSIGLIISKKNLIFDRLYWSIELRFFSSDDLWSNQCLFTSINYRHRCNQCFFYHQCPAIVHVHLRFQVNGGHIVRGEVRVSPQLGSWCRETLEGQPDMYFVFDLNAWVNNNA